ncbi:CaiB/BaiF CoA transferase family protein [Aromatoleum aromaticum]|uniref:Acyl-CoA transferase, family III n=1 Tax=Aromatoleum aromaticum (strain DSM 19018 / LMG 30748 / EbN1) TaxID=76114 RepID=Q5P029_AROAE|nr:CaiB/BaiF CoA-transferase family protein [Aromatoleum aromaticum]NMG54851.1 CoA transferase [Aromatoleum aromaticum]CAI09335.1 Acyl-CoA transferase, family III [Aromatoleum aromaticum EbN1]
MTEGKGPLAGVRVVEFGGIGPSPFCGMLLRQMGAEVLRIDRGAYAGALPIPERFDFLNKGKTRLRMDLKTPEALEQVLAIIDAADVLIEGFRPGVMERLGLGPEVCLARNPRLVYGRVTGWGREGPLADEAGHDITYISLTGALSCIGPAGAGPVPPLNLVGDFAGGALYLAFGVAAALASMRSTGRGQVVDAAMVDGAAHLMTFIYGLRQAGIWNLDRGSNPADGGSPFYGVYATSDGRWLAVAAAEMKFRRAFVAGLGLESGLADEAEDRAAWPRLRSLVAEAIARRSRDEWCELLAGRDACVAPVLDLDEAPDHPHAVARGVFVAEEGVIQPAPAPRFSEGTAPPPLCDAQQLLKSWGVVA